MKFLLGLGLCIITLAACSTSRPVKTSKKGINMEWFYGVWKVTAFRFHDGRVMPGAYMGYPQYEFDRAGKRTKTLNEEPAPPPEIIEYKLKGDSISYPTKPKFPAMKIVTLTQDSMVLRNDKLSWYLHK